MLFVVLDMMCLNMFPKIIVRMNVKPNEVNDYVKLYDVKSGDPPVVFDVDVRA